MKGTVIKSCKKKDDKPLISGLDNLHPKLQEVLPGGYIYIVEKFMNGEVEDHFDAELRLQISTQEEATAWIGKYKQMSKFGLLLLRTYPNAGKKYCYKVSYKCQCKKDNRQKTMSVYTDCPATLTVSLLKSSYSSRKAVNPFRMCVHINHSHNHGMEKKFLNRMKVSEEIEKKFRKMFLDGIKPAKAWEIHRNDIEKLHPENHISLFEKRSVVPDKKWCYNFYAKLNKSKGQSFLEENNGPSLEEQEVLKKQLYENTEKLCRLLSEHPKTLFQPLNEFAESLRVMEECEMLPMALRSFGAALGNQLTTPTGRHFVEPELPNHVESVRTLFPVKYQSNESKNVYEKTFIKIEETGEKIPRKRIKLIPEDFFVSDHPAIELICMDTILEQSSTHPFI